MRLVTWRSTYTRPYKVVPLPSDAAKANRAMYEGVLQMVGRCELKLVETRVETAWYQRLKL